MAGWPEPALPAQQGAELPPWYCLQQLWLPPSCVATSPQNTGKGGNRDSLVTHLPSCHDPRGQAGFPLCPWPGTAVGAGRSLQRSLGPKQAQRGSSQAVGTLPASLPAADGAKENHLPGWGGGGGGPESAAVPRSAQHTTATGRNGFGGTQSSHRLRELSWEVRDPWRDGSSLPPIWLKTHSSAPQLQHTASRHPPPLQPHGRGCSVPRPGSFPRNPPEASGQNVRASTERSLLPQRATSH